MVSCLIFFKVIYHYIDILPANNLRTNLFARNLKGINSNLKAQLDIENGLNKNRLHDNFLFAYNSIKREGKVTDQV